MQDTFWGSAPGKEGKTQDWVEGETSGCQLVEISVKPAGNSAGLLPTRTGFPGGSVVKNLPAMQETYVLFLGQGDALEKEMATHSSILPWKIPQSPGGLQSMGLQKSWTRLSD